MRLDLFPDFLLLMEIKNQDDVELEVLSSSPNFTDAKVINKAQVFILPWFMVICQKCLNDIAK